MEESTTCTGHDRTPEFESDSSPARTRVAPSQASKPPPKLTARPRPVAKSATQNGAPMSSQATLVGSLPSAPRIGAVAAGLAAGPSRVQVPEIISNVAVDDRAPPPPPKAKKRKRIAAVEPPEGVKLDEPPFRNTRARTRTVEPAPEPASEPVAASQPPTAPGFWARLAARFARKAA